MKNYTIESFTVKNYRSIYKEQEVFFDKNKPVTAFYGANASGKTNLYRAMAIFCQFVRNSMNPNLSGVPYDPFLLQAESAKKPSTFTIVFYNNESKYKYSFSLSRDRVIEEEMYDLSTNRARTIFVRSKGVTEMAAKNGFGKKMFIGNDAVRDDSLLITRAQMTKNPYANALFDVVNNMALLTLTDTGSLRGPAMEVLQKQPELFPRVIKVLQEADFSITDFAYSITKITSDMLSGAPLPLEIKEELIKNGKNISITTKHTVRDENGDKIGAVSLNMEQQESLGTNIFFNLIIIMIDAIDNGRILFLDEFGSSLHTNICQYIIRLFKEKGIKTGARLIINTHDVGLIKNGTCGILDKDDISVIEKDRFEETIVTPIKNKMRRSDDNIGKKYIMGLYGGIPLLEEAD